MRRWRLFEDQSLGIDLNLNVRLGMRNEIRWVELKVVVEEDA
jgi:hypothetical protein